MSPDNLPPPAYVPQLTPLGNDAMSHISTGVIFFESGRLKLAISSYQQAIQEHPHQTIAHLYLAKCWFQLRDFQQAESSCQAALELNPELVDALLLKGHLHAIREEWGLARESYLHATRADANLAQAHAMLGFVHRQLTDLPSANASYLTAVRLDPNVSFWWLALADVSNRLADYPLAQWAAEQALGLNPLLAQAQYQLGLAYQGQAHWDQAQKMFELASQGNTAQTFVLLQRARLWANSEGSDRVAPIIEVLETKYPRWVEVPLILGEAYLTDRNFTAALKAFEKAAKLSPGMAAPYYKMGLAYLGLERRSEAREHFWAACERESPPSPAHLALEQLTQETPDLAY